MALEPAASSDVPLGELPTDVVWRMSLDGEILYVSSEVQRVRGLSAEEAKAQMNPPRPASTTSCNGGPPWKQVATCPPSTAP